MKKDFYSARSLKKIVRLSSIFFALGTLSYSNVSYADVEGIPHNRDFPNAQYPYAQAPDGCSGWQNTRQIRDTWGPVNFTEACNNHDRCYYTRGSNWNTCNERFYSDLRTACERDLRTSTRVPAPTLREPRRTRRVDLPPDPARLSACYTVASGYYTGVQAGVLFNVFNEAQGKQKRYEEWVASVRNPTSLASSPSSVGRSQIVGLSNKCIGVRNGNSENGTPLLLWECNGNADQRWSLTSQGYLQGFAGKCIGVRNGNSENGTPLLLWECNGNADQRWSISP